MFGAFRPILLGIEDMGDGLVRLEILAISEESENFRKTVVPRSELKQYLDDELVKVPEGMREELAGVLMMEKLEAGEGLL